MATIKYWNGSAWELAIVGKQGPSGFVAQTDAPTDTSVLWLDTDEPSVSGIPATILDAKGDLIAASAADTAARLTVGTNGQVLTADSTTATGLKWADVSAGGMTSIATGTLSGSSVSLTSIPSTYNEILLTMEAVNTSADDVYIGITVNSDTGATAYQRVFAFTGTQTSGAGNATMRIFKTDNAVLTNYVYITFPNYKSTATYKMINTWAFGANAATTSSIDYFNSIEGWWANSSNAITSIQIAAESGTFEGGTYTLWGIK